MTLLKSNTELRADRVWNWTLPAWYVRLDDKIFKTCPNAGVCAQLCYARNGTYQFRQVKEAHQRNLELVVNESEKFMESMAIELSSKRFKPTGVARSYTGELVDDEWAVNWLNSGGAAIRIHDSGDFFADWYFELWLTLALLFPKILFYAYTKEVSMVKAYLLRGEVPDNFRIIFSKGGLQDELIDDSTDRHADVFPTLESLIEANYESQDESDLLAVLLKTNKIGIVANNIRHFKKRQGDETFASLSIRKRGE